jgi:NADH dehydrogenase [ubiquinone] 1 alpha subcomplex assembly factor 1
MYLSILYLLLMPYLSQTPMPTTSLNSQQEEFPKLMLFTATDSSGSLSWRPVNDGVMGGVSSSEAGYSASGHLQFSGKVSLENNGGFASIRTRFAKVDARSYKGFILRVKGDGKRYKINASHRRTRFSPGFLAAFETVEGEWTTVKVPFSKFQRTLWWEFVPMRWKKLRQVGILIANDTAETFSLELDWIGLY